MRERQYFRLILGKKHSYASDCFAGGFVGSDWFADEDLTGKFPERFREFNTEYIPKFLEKNPEKTKVAAGLACGMLHTICKHIEPNDVVVCPDGQGNYRFGIVEGDYYFERGGTLPHRRKVKWFEKHIPRNQFSEELRRSTGSIGTLSDISKHSAELEQCLAGESINRLISSDSSIEDPSTFAMEKHLEDFLIQNWATTELAQNYDIVEEDGEKVGQQFPTDTGWIDILAISKDRSEFLVIELKKGRASDSVVGQIQRYMGYIHSEIAEANQSVKGCIIAFEDDLRIKRALQINPLIEFYRYEINFKLLKA